MRSKKSQEQEQEQKQEQEQEKLQVQNQGGPPGMPCEDTMLGSPSVQALRRVSAGWQQGSLEGLLEVEDSGEEHTSGCSAGIRPSYLSR